MTKYVFAVLAVIIMADARAVESPLQADSVMQAIHDGNLVLRMRPRYQWVSQDSFDTARGGSLRSQLGWETLSYRGWKATAEVINSSRLDNHRLTDYGDYSTTYQYGRYQGLQMPAASAYRNNYVRLADPEITDSNRLFVDYDGPSGIKFRGGRLGISLDDERFVGEYQDGAVPQLFDGVTADLQATRALHLFYAHLRQVRAATGQRYGTRSDLIDLEWAPWSAFKLGGYGYFQAQDDSGTYTGVANDGNRIVGLRLTGNFARGSAVGLVYRVESARQKKYAGGDALIDARYLRLALGVEDERRYLRAEYERLGSNQGWYAFQTPLGSVRAHLGFSDMFYSTPAVGLIDRRLVLGVTIAVWHFYGGIHRYRSDVNEQNLGRELDLGVAWAATHEVTTRFELADYRAGDGGMAFWDTRKVWFVVEWAPRFPH